MNIEMKHIKEIAGLSKKSIRKLRKLNRELERAYTGKELTRYQLIFQIVFNVDAPDE
jgi:hypothetical protein